MVVVTTAATSLAKQRDAKRAKALAAKKRQHEAELLVQVDAWFTKFDTDGSASLEREELRALLSHLHPSAPITDDTLAMLMDRGGMIQSPDSSSMKITKESCLKTVQKFNCYIKDKEELDRLFSQFDRDGSGSLEETELLAILKSFAPNVTPSEADVHFILDHCDTDGSGSIDRVELLPMLAEWKEIALDKELLELQEERQARMLSGKKGKSGRKLVHPDPADGEGGDEALRPRGPVQLTRRQIVFATFDDPSYSTLAKVISITMMLVILISTLAFIAESETLETGALHDVAGSANDVFKVVEWVCVVIFTIDYFIRLVCSPKPHMFVVKVMNLIDLAAILPFWIMLGIPGGATESFSFVRVIRLIRVFRVFKLGRYSTGLQMFAGAMTGSMQPLGILVFVMTINMIIVSSILHLFEVGETGDEVPYNKEYCFVTIVNTFWWAVVTMTTVGYGDCYPITAGGKTVAVITMLSGVLILALPITVIGSNFAKMVEMFEEDNTAYTMTDGDGDGLVDEFELREFIVRKKKEGALLKNVDTKVTTLMAKYDPQGNGTLSKQEFTQLQRDIINPSHGDPFEHIHEMTAKVTANTQAMEHISLSVDARLAQVEDMLVILGTQMGMPEGAIAAINKNKAKAKRPAAEPSPAPSPPPTPPPPASSPGAAGSYNDGLAPQPPVAPSPPRSPPRSAAPLLQPLAAGRAGALPPPYAERGPPEDLSKGFG